MQWYPFEVFVETRGKGLYDITAEVNRFVRSTGVEVGVCFLFVPHTSASLVLNENWDPTARADLEAAMEHLVPEGQPWYVHTLEGADDSPAHIRTMLTLPGVTIPVRGGELVLGTWQGVYLFEHRRRGRRRRVVGQVLG